MADCHPVSNAAGGGLALLKIILTNSKMAGIIFLNIHVKKMNENQGNALPIAGWNFYGLTGTAKFNHLK